MGTQAACELRTVKHRHEIGEPKVRPFEDVLGHDGEALNTARATDDIGLQREFVLGTGIRLAVAASGVDRQPLPKAAAAIVALVALVAIDTIHMHRICRGISKTTILTKK